VSGRTFVDTNILIYAEDAASGPKRARAQDLIVGLVGSGLGVVSTQVLQEFFAVATRKLGLPAEHARRSVEFYARMQVVELKVPLVLEAIDLHRLRQVSLWDALIIRAAVAAGCTTLLSEDLQDGAEFDGLRVVLPFAGQPHGR